MNSEVPYPVDEKVLDKTIGGDKNRVRKCWVISPRGHAGVSAEMHHAFIAGSVVGVTNAAHKLKSPARIIGANSLADVCVIPEDAGKK